MEKHVNVITDVEDKKLVLINDIRFNEKYSVNGKKSRGEVAKFYKFLDYVNARNIIILGMNSNMT